MKSKRVAYWNKCKKELKEVFQEKGITTCEMRWPHDCFNNNFLSFAHRKKRREYYSEPEKLKDFNEVLLLCQTAHNMIEYNRDLTDKLFKELRGK